jgi:hypothetical protein
MKPARISVWAAVLLLGAGVINIAHAETFDLHVRAYCAPGTNCGFASYADYRQRVLDGVQEMNLQWRAAGVSFRPIVFSFVEDEFYSGLEGCNEGAAFDALRADWRANVASQWPNAITIMVTQGTNWCCTDPPDGPYNPPPNGDTWPNLLGIFCDANRTAYDLGTIWAHEMGHYWCLRHTFTREDTATSWPAPPFWDYDTLYNVNDTPPDPEKLEPYDPDHPLRGDLDANVNLQEGHEWCQEQTHWGTVDDGSPHPSYCSIYCYEYSGGVKSQIYPGTDPRWAMTYYSHLCRGPFVINGQYFAAFSPDSITQIGVCRAQVQERIDLNELCGTNGDFDNDGWCDHWDNCPYHMNTDQQNTDSDIYGGDVCDLCPFDPNPTGDMDDDGIGDICDADKDGDECDDTNDENSNQSSQVVGMQFKPGCGIGVEPSYLWDGTDSDGDGCRNCNDPDDDNDLVCDGPNGEPFGTPCTKNLLGCAAGPDPCPTSEADLCNIQILGAPSECLPAWLVCIGGTCVMDFFLKIVSVINPAEEVIFDEFRIANETIFLSKLPMMTISQMAEIIKGDFTAGGYSQQEAGAGLASGVTTHQLGDPVRMEIWSRRTNERVAIVAEYDESHIVAGDVTRSRFLAVTPTIDILGNPEILIDPIWAHYQEVGELASDLDTDGIPDVSDMCVTEYDPLQMDADGDGFGNACDADLNNDLMVGTDDVDEVASCEGADLTLEAQVSEPAGEDDGHENPLPDPAMLALLMRCAAADLNEDRLVDGADTAIATAALGLPPGPSAGPHAETCPPTMDCDDLDPCTVDDCNPLDLRCTNVPVDCNDFDPCTIDYCDPASGCEHSPVGCDDGNPCTRDTCEEGTGACLSEPEPDGLPCDSGDPCTEAETCRSGGCSGSPLVCDDGLFCTVDSCDPATGGCLYLEETCEDNNSCTLDACNERDDMCAYINMPNNWPCDDGDLCTEEDQCMDVVCLADPVVCDDTDPCTDDACDPASGSCDFDPVDCDDSDSCTVDSCDPTLPGCRHDPMPMTEVPELHFIDMDNFVWTPTPGATHWNSYRGTIPTLTMGSRMPGGSAYDHSCFENGNILLNGPTLSWDPWWPDIGTGYYYLVTEENGCGEGPAGWSYDGGLRPMPMPCPTPP